MDGKKISFGFMKTKKVDKAALEEKKEFIECVEEKSIRVLGGEEVKENTPLVIPMKPNTLVTAERLKEIAEKVESALDELEPKESPTSPKENPPENETLEQMAVRELMENAKKEVKVETDHLTVPLPPKSIADGEKESTLEDYESVPIQDFGLAMLRGMGWTPNNNNDKSKYKPPQLRPKGLGLGADKVVKDNQKQKATKDNKDEELSIVKNAYVKITTGKYSGYYAKVISLDEDNGRVMVELAVKKETVSLSEFMMHPVTKSEYDKESKVINSTTYEEYKRNEKSGGKSTINSDREKSSNRIQETSKYSEKSDKHYEKESTSRNEQNERREKERDRMNKDYSRDKIRERERHRDYSDDRQRRKNNSKKYSSNESLNSLSDSDKQRKDKKRYSSNNSLSSAEEKRYKKKDKKRYSSNDSLSSAEENRYKKKDKKRYSSSDSESDRKKKTAKRDIDKKRKGKKKKRDRDRSPNYRKHRK